MSGRVYADPTALLKRVTSEPDAGTARESLRAAVRRGDGLFSSAWSWVEISRVARQLVPIAGVAEFEEACLAGIAQVPLDENVITIARRIAPKSLTPDVAIHVATAVLLNATEVLTFDPVLARACRGVGLRLTVPPEPAAPPVTAAPAPSVQATSGQELAGERSLEVAAR